MKKISKLFSSLVLILAFSHTAFGHDKEWEFNDWAVNKNGLLLNIVAMYPGSTGSTESIGIGGGIPISRPINRVGIGTKKPGAALHVRGEESTGSNATLKISSGNKTMLLDGNEIDTAVGPLFLNCNSNRKVIIATSGGNVGIGKTNPSAALHIKGKERTGSNATLKISSGSQTMLLDGNEIDAAVDGLFLNHNSNGNVILAAGGGSVGIGKSNPIRKLDINGITRTKVIEITGGSDLSEKFDISKPHNIKNYIKQKDDFKIEPGMVTSIDPKNPGKLLVSSKAYDRTVAGIISGAGGVQPGMLMGQKGSEADGEYPVALTGRVYCKADATLGGIQPGDLLTTSDTPGYVMKVSDYERSHGATIGKAMSSLDKGKGMVLVLVSLQ